MRWLHRFKFPARDLDAMEIDYFVDADGVRHDWRRELAEELASRQRADGSWGQYPGAGIDLSATVKGYFALRPRVSEMAWATAIEITSRETKAMIALAPRPGWRAAPRAVPSSPGAGGT